MIFASLIWSSIGIGLLYYGRKATRPPALFAGVGLILISYFIGSALWMSAAGVGILAGMFILIYCGY